MNEDVIEASDAILQQLIDRRDKPIVVMFHLPTCPYCKVIEPHFRELAREYSDSCYFLRINSMNNPISTGTYNIMGTPTFEFICQGMSIREEVGVVYPQILENAIVDLIKHGNDCVMSTTPLSHEISPYE